jgi:hypothetical protein
MIKTYFILVFVIFLSQLNAQSDSITVVNNKNDSSLQVKEKVPELNQPPALGDVFKPKISLGVGMLSFHGDLYSKHYQAPWTGRIGYDLNISQRLFKSVQLNFNILFGKLGANEWNENRQENFQAEIRSGGVSLMYDFGNFIPDKCRLRPWISAGINSFEFLSKTDKLDKNGNQYFYWSDGSIKNIAESAPTASLAVNLNRDYTYETDIRESNKDGFGKYQERAWVFPVGAGALMKITDRFDLKLGFQYYFSTTDFVDGISNKSIGTRVGTKQKDNFVYTSFALQYDLVIKHKEKADTLPDGYYDGVDVLALDNGDYDEDGVNDFIDKCHGTPKTVKVDASGCPFDDDADGVPNFEDDELQTPAAMSVNSRGVSLDDEYWQNWYVQYMDSGDVAPNTQIVENFYAYKNDSLAAANASKNQSKNDKEFTIELARYAGPVPRDEMTYLLSIGDVKSTTLADNTTVLYTAGKYKEISNAIKRRDEFRAEGNKEAQIGYFKDGNLISLSEEEIKKLMDPNLNLENPVSDENQFAKGDIVYRVQLGAYANRISKEVFKKAGNVLELMSGDNVYRYATKGFRTIQEAANVRADLLIEGYGDAFITAYKDGKRIPMSQTNATMETKEKENIAEIPKFSSIDKSQITFKVQLGALRKVGNTDMDEKSKGIDGIEKQQTSSGMVRYTAGSFSDYSKADAYRQKLSDEGFMEAFVIALFKGEVISIQEAQELLK